MSYKRTNQSQSSYNVPCFVPLTLQLTSLHPNRAPLQIRLDFVNFFEASKIPHLWIDAEKQTNNKQANKRANKQTNKIHSKLQSARSTQCSVFSSNTNQFTAQGCVQFQFYCFALFVFFLPSFPQMYSGLIQMEQ